MRLAVVGDTHGDIAAAVRLLKERIKPDLLLFTGDYVKDGRKIAADLKLPSHLVAGNCDGKGAGRLEEIVAIGNERILLTHGHNYRVKTTMLPLKLRAEELGATAVCFGHTHVAVCERVDGIWFINPGSPTYPRSGGPSLAVLEIGEEGITPSLIEMRRG